MILTYLRYYICVRFQWMLVIRGRSSDHGCWWNERRGVANAFIRLAARKKSGNDSFGSSFSAFNQVGDLGSDLRVANGDFSQEKVRERGAVGDEGHKGRFNMGVKKKSGPYFEAGRRSASGRGDLLGPAKSFSLDSLGANDLGQNTKLAWINFWEKGLWNWRITVRAMRAQFSNQMLIFLFLVHMQVVSRIILKLLDWARKVITKIL
ncbi:hypothetical protein ES332_D07G182400v1 [Gossypium tomentosum]|uniref:Uncharacterized protein n=1 Tax=Gossypium tomentosum TaxID=34277 RepID=A0A5D2K8I4_GOSTO|nr:hypothetical protein ES332_D07G182400v1 [Gossypium tomentosum]